MDDHDRHRTPARYFFQAVPYMRLSGQRRIVPLADIGKEILKVEKPSRYLGGETGSIVKYDDSLLSVAICFPDLYEIGMSNNAIKLSLIHI